MKFCFFGLSPCGRGMRTKQREELESKYQLKHRGENCCCPVYSIMHNANEVNKQEEKLAMGKGYQKPGKMEYASSG